MNRMPAALHYPETHIVIGYRMADHPNKMAGTLDKKAKYVVSWNRNGIVSSTAVTKECRDE
jgi:hypothetical protein